MPYNRLSHLIFYPSQPSPKLTIFLFHHRPGTETLISSSRLNGIAHITAARRLASVLIMHVSICTRDLLADSKSRKSEGPLILCHNRDCVKKIIAMQLVLLPRLHHLVTGLQLQCGTNSVRDVKVKYRANLIAPGRLPVVFLLLLEHAATLHVR
ncbi:hypothetical protein PILCRDRAFT_132273 [Piloderma croceum F 1598]|uniref:Uncharacterized protein n=1 Tax=Piloderma croceum (strain F 1598) TaxID=765440 RepID=A0A0C3CP66_PILCF|nr:hypothetical protein PILCRDRAFT_132273 [Piloderma croceum F 1598]